jgi:putative nucleotidyltransferase with HDIG domain
MDSQTMLKKLDRIDALPTLPTIAMEVNNMLQDDDTSIKDLTQTIEKDQAIVQRILKLVNSAFFGFQSTITDISRAVAILGFNTIRNVIISVSVINAFKGKDTFKGFDITDFWVHSVGVAITSKTLAVKTRLHPPEDAFTGGLLHDIGKIVLSQYFQDLFKKIWVSTRENNLSFYEAEHREIPIDHAQIGGYLAKKWGLPSGLIDTIRYHHVLSKSADGLNMMMIVHAADIILNRLGRDSENELDLSVIKPEAVVAMKPHLETASDWFPGICEEIKEACEFFIDEG